MKLHGRVALLTGGHFGGSRLPTRPLGHRDACRHGDRVAVVDAVHGDGHHLTGGGQDLGRAAVVLVAEHQHRVLGQVGVP